MTQLASAGVFRLRASTAFYHDTLGLSCGGWESRDMPFLVLTGSDFVPLDVQNGAQVSPDIFHLGQEQLNIIRKSALFNHLPSPFLVPRED